MSTKVILQTLWDAGYSWQERRTWCHTGEARRKHKDGSVVVITPHHLSGAENGPPGASARMSAGMPSVLLRATLAGPFPDAGG